MNLIRTDGDYGRTRFGTPSMSGLSHFAQLFSASPSALRAVLLGFGLAFAATDPSVAVAGKATTPVVQAAAHAGMTQAFGGPDRSVAPEDTVR